jgi:hypothetical protein
MNAATVFSSAFLGGGLVAVEFGLPSEVGASAFEDAGMPFARRAMTAAMPGRRALMPLRTVSPAQRSSAISLAPKGSAYYSTSRGKWSMLWARQHAAQCLGSLGSVAKDAVEALSALQEDKDEKVQKAAAEALKAIQQK